MESDKEEILSPMLLEMSPDSPPPGETKKRAWPRRLQIPLGILFVGLVAGGAICFLSLADSKEVERVKAGNLSLGDFGDFQERDRRNGNFLGLSVMGFRLRGVLEQLPPKTSTLCKWSWRPL